VFSKSKIFKFLKRDWGTIPVAEIINGKIEIFSKHQKFLIATESSKYLLIFVLYVCVILCEFGTAISFIITLAEYEIFLDILGRIEEAHKINIILRGSSGTPILQGVSAKTFELNNSVIFQRIFMKFKMQIF
jgi:hypothetical protein